MVKDDTTEPYSYTFWNKEFLEQKNIIANLEAISYDELSNQLIELDSKTKIGVIGFDDLVDSCFKIVCSIPVLLVAVDVPYLVRCRPNEPKQIFTNPAELSYNPFQERIDYGRFNLKREPIFYAVTPSESLNSYPEELASIYETCKDLKKADTVILENRHVTVSYWKVSKPFYAVVLSLYDDGINKNLTLQNMNLFFESIFENKFTTESRKIISTLYKYLSSKASSIKESNNDYLITTAFRHALEKYYAHEIKALIYSGADSDNNCINIALTKNTVDEKFIEFDKAIIYEIMTARRIHPLTGFSFPFGKDYFMFNLNKKY